MAWNEVTPMAEITRFGSLAASGRFTLTRHSRSQSNRSRHTSPRALASTAEPRPWVWLFWLLAKPLRTGSLLKKPAFAKDKPIDAWDRL